LLVAAALVQIRLLEPLAAAFAWHFSAIRVDKDIRHLSKSLSQGELGNIADIHATLAGTFTAGFCFHPARSLLTQLPLRINRREGVVHLVRR
jgi:hypothetical protein